MKKILWLSLIVIPFFLFTACEKENGETGTLKLYITDSPIDTDGIKSVYITVTGIHYHTSENGWRVVEEYEGPKKFDLLELQRGNSELLGSFELEAGTYTQIRFMLDAPVRGGGPPSNPGSYLVFEDGTEQNLFVPSGAQTGYKAVGTFTVPMNGTVEVTADFDVRKSVIKAGKSGKYILKPTIRLQVNSQAGRIEGEVINIPDDAEVVIYAYKSGAYDESEADEPAEEEIRFPGAVSSDMADENGFYHLAYLAPGAYDLVVVSIVDGDFGQVLGIVENVNVESRATTRVDIDIEEF
jgi:hypothetical protein